MSDDTSGAACVDAGVGSQAEDEQVSLPPAQESIFPNAPLTCGALAGEFLLDAVAATPRGSASLGGFDRDTPAGELGDDVGRPAAAAVA